MSSTKINFREQRSKAVAVTAVFAGLFAIGNMIGVTGFVSMESIITFICGALFGPQVAFIAAIAGEGIAQMFFPASVPLFLVTIFIADGITGLIIGYGRKMAFFFERKFHIDKRKARILAESISYLLIPAFRYSFYQLFDIIALNVGWLAPQGSNTIDQQILVYAGKNFINMGIKMVFLPLCILLVEQIRRNTKTLYYDIDIPEDLKIVQS
ncbi:MAG: hypothetical protein ACFFCS_20505 [Candidatus Hodarchaeota archaeon]